jgi:hypothetical protein
MAIQNAIQDLWRTFLERQITGTFTDGSRLLTGRDGATKATMVNPVPTSDYGTGDFTSAQVSVTTAATLIATGKVNRKAVLVSNGSDTDMFLGKSNVTTSNGLYLKAGTAMEIRTRASVYAINATGAKTITVMELHE